MGDADKLTVKRDENGRFGPGNPGGGRKKIPPEVREMLEAALPRAAEVLIQSLDATKWVGGAAGIPPIEVEDYDMRLKAANAVFDRICGKPAQAVTGEDGGPIALTHGHGLIDLLRRLAE